MDSPLKTEGEAAKYLGISPSSIRNLRYAGKISYRRIGSSARYLKSDLDEYIEQVRQPTVEERAQSA